MYQNYDSQVFIGGAYVYSLSYVYYKILSKTKRVVMSLSRNILNQCYRPSHLKNHLFKRNFCLDSSLQYFKVNLEIKAFTIEDLYVSGKVIGLYLQVRYQEMHAPGKKN